MEKDITRFYLYPILTKQNFQHLFSDQFAFRPTGSTTAALIYLLEHVTRLLQIHEFVHIIALDFSKAFDTVRHHTLVSKMADFPLPDSLHNWIVNYLSDRQHQTKLNGIASSLRPINASIIQGSGLGPVEYVYNASDLHPLFSDNIFCKYADDTYLIVPSNNTNLIPSELQNLSQWATVNNLTLNASKSCEMVVHSLNKKKHIVFPNPLPDIDRVDSMCILGVIVSNTLSFKMHVNNIVVKANRSFYALKTLHAHGLDGQALWDVTRATLVAQLLYASPAWWGFLKADDKSRLQSLLTKAQRYGYLPCKFDTLDTLCESLDQTLFHSTMYNTKHVLHQLLPPPKETGYNLRHRSHSLTIPSGVTNTMKQNFINRKLFYDIY